MSVYMQSTLELKGGALPQFSEAMMRLLPIVEAVGWKLHHALVQTCGRLHTVVDLWEMDDLNHYERGLTALMGHAAFPAIEKVLIETVQKETVVFGHAAPYCRPGAGS